MGGHFHGAVLRAVLGCRPVTGAVDAAAPAPGEPEATITFEVTALDVHRITAVHARVHRPGDGTAPEDGAEDRAVEVPAHQKESAR